jgi:hypothetical protein
MPIYKAPLDDVRFLLKRVLAVEGDQHLPVEDARGTVMSVLEEGGKLCEEVLARSNQSGDAGGVPQRERGR